MQDGLLISIDDAAEILGVTRRQVHNHIASGRLASVKDGKRRLLSETDVRRLAAELAVDPHAIVRSSTTAESALTIQRLEADLAIAQRTIHEVEYELRSRPSHMDVQRLEQERTDALTRANLIEQEVDRLRKSERYYQDELRKAYERGESFWSWIRRKFNF
jgi:excisionase family DNA binding protein